MYFQSQDICAYDLVSETFLQWDINMVVQVSQIKNAYVYVLKGDNTGTLTKQDVIKKRDTDSGVQLLLDDENFIYSLVVVPTKVETGAFSATNSPSVTFHVMLQSKEDTQAWLTSQG